MAETLKSFPLYTKLTSLLPVDMNLNIRLFERAPFEILLVTTTLDISASTLLTPRLLFTTLQSFRFARHAACVQTPSVRLSPTHIRNTMQADRYHCGSCSASAWPRCRPLQHCSSHHPPFGAPSSSSPTSSAGGHALVRWAAATTQADLASWVLGKQKARG